VAVVVAKELPLVVQESLTKDLVVETVLLPKVLAVVEVELELLVETALAVLKAALVVMVYLLT
jgi:hypothetical protein